MQNTAKYDSVILKSSLPKITTQDTSKWADLHHADQTTRRQSTPTVIALSHTHHILCPQSALFFPILNANIIQTS